MGRWSCRPCGRSRPSAFTATLDDPDGATSNPKWQWSKSRSKNGAYSPIDTGPTSATYMPKDGDIGSYLRATVTYTDPEDEDKTAKMESAFTVQAVRGTNMAPEFAADQDPNTPDDQDGWQRGLWRRIPRRARPWATR